jgi:hypothetical protein
MTTDDGLQGRLGLASATSIVVANMVGAGVFTTSGLLMRDLHDARLMLAVWGVGGLIALGGALCYGELGAGGHADCGEEPGSPRRPTSRRWLTSEAGPGEQSFEQDPAPGAE